MNHVLTIINHNKQFSASKQSKTGLEAKQKHNSKYKMPILTEVKIFKEIKNQVYRRVISVGGYIT